MIPDKQLWRLAWEAFCWAVTWPIPGTPAWNTVQDAKQQARLEQKLREVELQKAIIREAILEAAQEQQKQKWETEP